MASGIKLRESGMRKSMRQKNVSKFLSNSFGLPSGSPAGEHRVNLQQIHALENMFQSNPAVRAARTVLSGQLLSGGICLRKNGQEVKLTPEFDDHLNRSWLSFAQDVIDSFLKWGFVVVSYEHSDDYTTKVSTKRQKKESNDANSNEVEVLIPIVPTLGTYEVAYFMGGRKGYKREYMVYATNAIHGNRIDEDAKVVINQHPDQAGNVNSPLSSVFELGSFVGALTELALVAESSRSRPRMVTQMQKKENNSMDPSSLFFDSESRAIQAGADIDESAGQARALQLQQSMCDIINRLQTRNTETGQDNKSFHTTPSLTRGYAPPEVSPTLFHLPKVGLIWLFCANTCFTNKQTLKH